MQNGRKLHITAFHKWHASFNIIMVITLINWDGQISCHGEIRSSIKLWSEMSLIETQYNARKCNMDSACPSLSPVATFEHSTHSRLSVLWISGTSWPAWNRCQICSYAVMQCCCVSVKMADATFARNMLRGKAGQSKLISIQLRIQKVVTMMYNTQIRCVSGLCPSPGILSEYKTLSFENWICFCLQVSPSLQLKTEAYPVS
jgi:hypothetical protein